LWLRHRAIAVIVCASAPVGDLDDLSREAAGAIELIDGYTDQFAAARRREPVSTPAQLQQDLLPPRIAAGRGAELAACILPAYDVGGDWFDHAVAQTGAWLALGDAMGKGLTAAASSALAVSAQRAVRQSGGSLPDAAWAIHDAVSHAGDGEAFMTVVLAQWDARDHTLNWINCGHPSPLLRRPGRPLAALDGPRTLPLGIADLPPKIHLAQERLQTGDQVLIYSDGVSERRLADGQALGVAGIARALDGAGDSATATVSRVQRAVIAAGPDDLSDDATLLALRVLADDQHEPAAPGARRRRR
jgi:serine phosphatase RsbU (regulator of sigma subunit)